jgi:hypothetical protein
MPIKDGKTRWMSLTDADHITQSTLAVKCVYCSKTEGIGATERLVCWCKDFVTWPEMRASAVPKVK